MTRALSVFGAYAECRIIGGRKMHEMSIAKGIVELVRNSVDESQQKNVARVVVRVGAWIAVVPESLAFCYEAITEGTSIANSRLVVDEVPIVVRCRNCGVESTVEKFRLCCRSCGATKVDAITGEELMVSRIELE